jgi:hypothetical protein
MSTRKRVWASVLFVLLAILTLNIEKVAEVVGLDNVLLRLGAVVGWGYRNILLAPWMLPSATFVLGAALMWIVMKVGSAIAALPPADPVPATAAIPRMTVQEAVNYITTDSVWTEEHLPRTNLSHAAARDLLDLLAAGSITAFGRELSNGRPGTLARFGSDFWRDAHLDADQFLRQTQGDHMLQGHFGMGAYFDVRFFEGEIRRAFPAKVEPRRR